MEPGWRVEELGGGVRLVVSKAHGFTVDSLALSWFSAQKKWDQAVDLCSGCGIVPMLWHRGRERPGKAWAVELQAEAVRQLRESIALSGIAGLEIVHGDLRELRGVLSPGGRDLVTCNPPYYAAGSGAVGAERLARHEAACTLDDVVSAAARLLRNGGRFCLCHLPERLPDILEAMRVHGLEPKRLRLCQAGAEKAPWLVLLEGKKGARPGLTVEPVLLLKEHDAPTREALEICGPWNE